LNGFICIDKPVGPTSFAALNRLKRAYGQKKIGHAGTLDPQASGLLLVALGSATRLLPYLPTEPKEYHFGIQFGFETDTLDDAGKAVHEGGRLPCRDEIIPVIERFIGTTQQTPPRYSALKIDGKRAYDRARKGEEFEPRPRPITVTRFSLDSYNETEGRAQCTVECSGGTYVRAIARDVALALGSFGHAVGIHRSAIGPFSLKEAVSLEMLQSEQPPALMSIAQALANFPHHTLSEAQLQPLLHGMDIELTIANPDNKPVLLLDGSGGAIALAHRGANNRYHPRPVLTTAGQD
jgi:tRNA pseudouridine55 synthase